MKSVDVLQLLIYTIFLLVLETEGLAMGSAPAPTSLVNLFICFLSIFYWNNVFFLFFRSQLLLQLFRHDSFLLPRQLCVCVPPDGACVSHEIWQIMLDLGWQNMTLLFSNVKKHCIRSSIYTHRPDYLKCLKGSKSWLVVTKNVGRKMDSTLILLVSFYMYIIGNIIVLFFTFFLAL